MPATSLEKPSIDGDYDWCSPESGTTSPLCQTVTVAQSGSATSTAATARSTCSSACSERERSQDERLEKNDGLVAVPYSMQDLELVETFYDLADIQDSSVETLKLLLQTVMMLRSCGYDMHDVCIVLAHASVYFNDIVKKCDKMSAGEAGYIVVLLMYMAHSYAQDENCQLQTWHKYLFKRYCSLLILDKALMSMMKLRGYILRVDESVLQQRLDRLLPKVKK